MNDDFFELLKTFMNNPANMELFRKGMEGLRERGQHIKAEGSAGGDMVRATVNGALELESIHIDPMVVDKRDVAMLEQLVVIACRNAQQKVREQLGQGLGAHFPGS